MPGGKAENSLGMALLKFFRESKGTWLTAMSAFSGKGQSRIAANYDNFWTRTRCTAANHAVLFFGRSEKAHACYFKAERRILAVLKRAGWCCCRTRCEKCSKCAEGHEDLPKV